MYLPVSDFARPEVTTCVLQDVKIQLLTVHLSLPRDCLFELSFVTLSAVKALSYLAGFRTLFGTTQVKPA